jgi:translocator protein
LMLVVRPYSTRAVWLLVPYLAWVGFAAYLNFTIVRLNAPFGG